MSLGSPLSYERDKYSEVYVVDRTGDRLASLSTANVEDAGWILDEIGEASFSLPASDPLNKAVILGKTEILMLLDGVPWWGRVSRVKTNYATSTYECADLLSYYKFRFVLNASLEYASIDQLSIATLIHEQAQSGTLRSFNIVTGFFNGSGRIRSRQYDRWQHPNILDMLSEFPKLDDGFDFGIEYDASGIREFVCYYPRKGSYKPNLSLVLGKNIRDFNVDEDADVLATRVYATGGSNGEVKFEQNSADDIKAGFYGTHYEDVISDGDQKDVAWLLDKAVHEIEERKDVVPVVGVTVSDDPVKVFGNLIVGDTTRVIIKRGRIDINDRYRLVEIKRTSDRMNELTLVHDG